MRKVLLICYYFPPLGLGGVGRPLNLFRGLRAFEWDCHILTVKPVAYRAYEPDLLNDLDLSRIHRSGSLDPQRLMYLLGIRTVRGANIERARSASNRFFPDPKIGWVRKAVRLGHQLIENQQYDALISTSPPISSHLVARELAREHSLPWVADFRDYWTAYKIEQSYSDAVLIERANKLRQGLVAGASHVTAVNQSITDYLGRGEVVYNAFDESLALLWQAPAPSTPFTIGVVGHQHDTETLAPIYASIRRCIEQIAIPPDNVRILHVGQTDRQALDALLDNSPRLSVEITSRLSRDQYVRRLSETSVIMFGVFSADNHDFVPGKLFDLLPSGRPLLIFGRPDGEVAQIVRPSEHNLVFNDPAVAAPRLSEIYTRHRDHTSSISVFPEYSRAYAASALARRFAVILDRLVNKNSYSAPRSHE